MKLITLTLDQVKNHSEGNFNPAEWNKRIDRYMAFQKNGEVEFFVCPAGDGYDYDRLFVKYVLDEGITLLNTCSLITSITSTPFTEAHFNYISGDIRTGDPLTYEVEFYYEEKGQRFRIANNPGGRKFMAHMSSKLGYIWTNNF